MNLEELVVPLMLDNSKYTKGIDDSIKKASSLTSGLAKVGGGIVLGALAGVTAGVVGLTGFLAESTQAASESADIHAQLEAVLASTGNAAGVSAKQADDLATSLSQVTKFEDDTILSGENMLLTFTNIGKNVFPNATETMLDMSQALGQDLQSSAIQLGKALNDPVKGVTALQRVGVTFTDSQKDMIASLVKAGKTEEAQKVILAELNKEFGNSAKAAGATLSGKLEILKNNFGNLQETVGNALLPVMSDLASQANTWLSDPKIQENITNITNKIAELARQAVQYIPQMISKFQELVSFFQNNQGILVGILAALGVALIAFSVTAVASMAPIIAGMLPVIAIMALVGVAAYALYNAWKSNFGGIQDKVRSFWNEAKPIFNQVVDWLKINIPVAIDTLKSIWSTAWNVITQIFNTVWTNLKTIWNLFRAAFTGDWVTFGQMLRQIWETNWNTLVAFVTTIWNNLKLAVQNVATNILNIFKNTDWAGVGRAIIDGIIGGVSAWGNRLLDQARGIVSAINSIFRGINTPNIPSSSSSSNSNNNNSNPPKHPNKDAGFASGIENFVVPSGYPNDSFMVGLTSGERVNVDNGSGTASNAQILKALQELNDKFDMRLLAHTMVQSLMQGGIS